MTVARNQQSEKSATVIDRRYRFMVVFVALLFASCLGSRNYQDIPAEGPPPTAQYLKIESEISVATLHFPVGVYTLSASDSTGYYYRAPQKIIQHVAGGWVPHQGGIYVRKDNRGNLRGYVFMSGALTHVGNFSNVEHQFR